jgi:hypothetical protein
MPGLYRADARALVWRRAGMVDGVAGVGESRQPGGVCRRAGGGVIGRRWGQRERHGWVFLFYFNKIRWVMCRQKIGCCKTSVLQTDRIVGAPYFISLSNILI